MAVAELLTPVFQQAYQLVLNVIEFEDRVGAHMMPDLVSGSMEPFVLYLEQVGVQADFALFYYLLSTTPIRIASFLNTLISKVACQGLVQGYQWLAGLLVKDGQLQRVEGRQPLGLEMVGLALEQLFNAQMEMAIKLHFLFRRQVVPNSLNQQVNPLLAIVVAFSVPESASCFFFVHQPVTESSQAPYLGIGKIGINR